MGLSVNEVSQGDGCGFQAPAVTLAISAAISSSYGCCYRSANKLQQGCCQADIRMCSHGLFPVVVACLEQVVSPGLIQG
jgi:hypothetical protein